MAASARRQRDITLPPLKREILAADPFTQFDEWLDEVEHRLDPLMMLLALDEFEVLDEALNAGRFSEGAVLGMLRHVIQHRSRFKVLLAGSHTLDELQRWASYLINVELLHLSYLQTSEARHLIERPVPEFALVYDPMASQHVIDLTRGHPYLVQLLCSEIVGRKNTQPPALRRQAQIDDVEAAVPSALRKGGLFFADIARNQIDAVGLAVLHFLAAQGGKAVTKADLADTFPQDLDRTLARLTQRDLIEDVEGGLRFQVELIRRWFAQGQGDFVR
jgi:hypothetical protein